MANRVKARKDKSNVIAYSENAIRNNHSLLEHYRTSMSALSGATAGIIGLTGITGFVFYFLIALLLWVIILAHMGPAWDKYVRGRLQILTNGLGGGLFTYVLFWTFLYGMVHVY